MRLETCCLFATIFALVLVIDPVHGESARVSGSARPAAPPPAAEVEPRAPDQFEYGQYHRSSKMTPGGSKGPQRWGDERDDVGPQAGTRSGASGADDAARAKGRTGEAKGRPAGPGPDQEPRERQR